MQSVVGVGADEAAAVPASARAAVSAPAEAPVVKPDVNWSGITLSPEAAERNIEATNLRESRLPHDEDEEGIEVLWLPPAQVLAGLRDGSLVGSASTVAAAMHAVILLAGRPGGA